MKNIFFSSIILGSLIVSSAVQAMPRKFIFSFKPPTQGTPGYTIGGAVRGGVCDLDSAKSAPMVALTSDSILTTSSHPTFFVSLPVLDNDKKATLIVKDKEANYYETQDFDIPAKGGIVNLNLADSKLPLSVGTDYEWIFQLHCGSVAQIDDPVVEGKVVRVEADSFLNVPMEHQNEAYNLALENQLQTVASKGIWYDTLTLAYQLKLQGSSQYWDNLISTINN